MLETNIADAIKQYEDKLTVNEEVIEISNFYRTEIEKHSNFINEMKKSKIDILVSQIPTSSLFVWYFLCFNILNMIGYTIMIIAANHGLNFKYLKIYLIGFVINGLSTFLYELSHNYLLFRSFFYVIFIKSKLE